jgi:hypothetical protein
MMLLGAAWLPAQDLAFAVQHDHLRKGGDGTLSFTGEGVRWEETGKKAAEHSREWKYEDIQRLELAPAYVRVLTYDDVGWQLGRDREYRFDHLPAELAPLVYARLTTRLDQRFLAHVADPAVIALWELPAKLLLGRGGSNGTLKVGATHIVFDGGEKGESRTWKYAEITDVSTSGPFDLALTTIEGENRLQLKQALPEDRYNDLWRSIHQTHGLKTYNSPSKGHNHD